MFTTTKRSKRARRRAGYSLVEVLAASGIISIAVGAAAALSMVTVGQEESGNRVARAISIQENAGRMFRLGMSPAEIIRLLPPDPVVSSISIVQDQVNIAGVGTVDRAQIDIQFLTSPSGAVWNAGKWTGGPGGSGSLRVSPTVTVYRTTVRAGSG